MCRGFHGYYPDPAPFRHGTITVIPLGLQEKGPVPTDSGTTSTHMELGMHA